MRLQWTAYRQRTFLTALVAILGIGLAEKDARASFSAVTPTALISGWPGAGTPIGVTPQALSVDFGGSYKSCGGLPDSYSTGGHSYPSVNAITLRANLGDSGSDLYRLSEWFDSSTYGWQYPIINGTGTTPELTEVHVSIFDADVADLILGIDVNNQYWQGETSQTGCDSLNPSDWTWTAYGSALAYSTGASYAPSVGGHGFSYSIASDQADDCNSYGDSYVNVLYDPPNQWYQQSVSGTTALCSRFVAVDLGPEYLTLERGGEIWSFTPNNSTPTTSTIGSKQATVANADTFAVAGDDSGFAATTGTPGSETYGANGSTLYVGNFAESNVVNVKFNSSFACVDASSHVTIDNITFDELGHNLYFACATQTATPKINVYEITQAQVCQATGGSGSPCSCTGHTGCVYL